jgi:hypothetical protein
MLQLTSDFDEVLRNFEGKILRAFQNRMLKSQKRMLKRIFRHIYAIVQLV